MTLQKRFVFYQQKAVNDFRKLFYAKIYILPLQSLCQASTLPKLCASAPPLSPTLHCLRSRWAIQSCQVISSRTPTVTTITGAATSPLVRSINDSTVYWRTTRGSGSVEMYSQRKLGITLVIKINFHHKNESYNLEHNLLVGCVLDCSSFVPLK